jgi:hypothetical protein
MKNVYELKKGKKKSKILAKQLENIYLCPSSEYVNDFEYRDCVIWKTMEGGCVLCPFRTFDL